MRLAGRPAQAFPVVRFAKQYALFEKQLNAGDLSLTFADVIADGIARGLDLGFDYTLSDTESEVDVTATAGGTAPLPELRSQLNSVTAWARIEVGERASLRFSIENSRLETDDFALDNVVPDTLANVLTLGESAANYDVILVSGSLTYRF